MTRQQTHPPSALKELQRTVNSKSVFENLKMFSYVHKLVSVCVCVCVCVFRYLCRWSLVSLFFATRHDPACMMIFFNEVSSHYFKFESNH